MPSITANRHRIAFPKKVSLWLKSITVHPRCYKQLEALQSTSAHANGTPTRTLAIPAANASRAQYFSYRISEPASVCQHLSKFVNMCQNLPTPKFCENTLFPNKGLRKYSFSTPKQAGKHRLVKI